MNITNTSLEKIILDRLLMSKKVSYNGKITSIKVNIKVKKYRKIVYFLTADFGTFDTECNFENVPAIKILQNVSGLTQIEILQKLMKLLAFLKDSYSNYVYELEFVFK